MIETLPDTGSLADLTDYVAEWRIREFIGGGTCCIDVGPDGQPATADVQEAIAHEIDEGYIANCSVDFRRMDSGEDWRPLTPSADSEQSFETAAEQVIEAIEYLVDAGVVFSVHHSERLARALRLGGVSA